MGEDLICVHRTNLEFLLISLCFHQKSHSFQLFEPVQFDRNELKSSEWAHSEASTILYSTMTKT